jgi:DNA-directed RNA polymerase II subunit RPB1
MQYDDIPQLPPLGEVVAIQAFMPSATHIRNTSVLEIETLEDVNSGKLGVVEWGTACEHCDGFLEDCPGHFGHLELPIPAYRVFFVHNLLEIMSSVCYYCQNLRMPKTDPKYAWIRSLEPQHRLKYLAKYSKPYKRCGKEQDDTQDSRNFKTCCGKLFPNFMNEDRDAVFVKVVVPLDLRDFDAFQNDANWQPVTISPKDLMNCLSLFSDEVKMMLGCVEDLNCPDSNMWEVLPIASHNTRPAHTFANMGAKKKSFNDWTKLQRFIVTARNDLRKEIEKAPNDTVNIAWYSVSDIISKQPSTCFKWGYLEKKVREAAKPDIQKINNSRVMTPVELAWRSMNKQIAAFHSHKHKKFANKGSVFGKPPLGVESRYKHQKLGRYRSTVTARRVENAARGVLEGDMRIRPDQLIVPLQLAMTLTFPEYVTAYNRKEAHTWIANGPYIYPGANSVIMKNGKEIDLANFENRRDIRLDDVFKVKRHILENDVLIVNRQPTLHRPSLFCLFAIVQKIFVFRIHYSVFKCLGADCDGDELVVHVPQTHEARAELVNLCSVKNCIMKDGNIWVNFIQNAVVGAYLLTRPGFKLDKQRMCDLVSALDDVWEFPEPDHNFEYTGQQIVSLMLPKDFSMEDCGIVIHNGVMISGQLNESALNGRNGILAHMVRDYCEKDIVVRFIFSGYLLFQRYIDQFGLTAGYYDCAIDPRDEDRFAASEASSEPSYSASMQKVFAELRDTDANVERLRAYCDTFPNHNPANGSPEIEENIQAHIQLLNQQSCDAVNAYHNLRKTNESNGILHVIQSGTKGSPSTLNSMGGKVGQVFVIYKRFGCVSSHFAKSKNTLGAFGFINENYTTGISLPSVMIEAHAACESVVNKNKGTSKSGYTVRKLTTCMMGVVIDHQSRAVDTNGRVIWNKYGNDGFDSQMLAKVKKPKARETSSKTSESEHLRQLHENAAKCKSDFLGCFQFPHLFLRAKIHFLQDKTVLLHPNDYFRAACALWETLVRADLVLDSHANLKLYFFDWLGSESMMSAGFGLGHIAFLANAIRAYHERAKIQPGESVGTLGTQNMGEPFSQMSLKTPHLSGKFRGVFSGTVRIANMVDSNFANPTMTVVLKKRIKTHLEAVLFGLSILRCTLESISLGFPSFVLNSNKACFRFELDRAETIKRVVSAREIARNMAINSMIDLENFRSSFADEPEYWIEMDVLFSSVLWQGIIKVMNTKRAPVFDNRAIADVIAHNFYSNVVVHGFPEIENFVVDQNEDKRFVVTTLGSSFSRVLALSGVDARRSTCNDCIEMCNVLGLHAARKSVEYEFCNVFKGMADERHIKLVSRVMASDLEIKGMKISQIAQNIPMLQRAAYEQGPKQMTDYCSKAEIDHAHTICGASLANKLMNVGTGFCLDPIPVVPEIPPIVSVPHETRMCDYCFSFKVTGLRVMLVFSQDRAKKKLCSLYHRNGTVYSLPNSGIVPDALFSGTVLDGDIVVLTDSNKLCFIVHDILLSSGNVCSGLRYDQRIEIAREVVFRIGTSNLSVAFQEAPGFMELEMGADASYTLPTCSRAIVSRAAFKPGAWAFFITVKPIFSMEGLVRFDHFMKPKLGFPTDGYVFTSISMGAFAFRNNPKSVYKWKPENTIDVIVYSADPGLKYSDTTGVDEFRTATGAYFMVVPNDLSRASEQVVFSKMDTDWKVESGAVYECAWVDARWKITLSRDKQPNKMSVVLATIRNIRELIGLHEFI